MSRDLVDVELGSIVHDALPRFLDHESIPDSSRSSLEDNGHYQTQGCDVYVHDDLPVGRAAGSVDDNVLSGSPRTNPLRTSSELRERLTVSTPILLL